MPSRKSVPGVTGEDETGGVERRRALEVLLEAREKLVQRLAEEVLSQRDDLLDDPDRENLYGFGFQELEERYMARLQALNSILDNLEYRRPRISHKVEVLASTRENLSRDLNDLVARYDEWDLVDIDVTPIEERKLLVVVTFTADEYDD